MRSCNAHFSCAISELPEEDAHDTLISGEAMGAIGKKVLVVAICVLVLAAASFAIRKLAQSNVDRESAARADAEVQKRKAEAVIQPPSLSPSGASKDKGPGASAAKPTLGRSTGCGKSATGTGDFARTTIGVLGRDRTYHLRLPHTYDPNRAYPLVFRWHGSGGDGLSGGLDIELSSVNDAIVVGADGLNKEWVIGTRAHDLALFDAMLEAVSKRYCIDRDRVFSYGFSDGGFITNDLACRRGDVLRASAAVAGGFWSGKCKGKVAVWFVHDTDDKAVPIAQGREARDRVLASNGCSTDTVDEGDGCVRYKRCGASPVVWCQSSGIGHSPRGDFAPPRVWKFFSELP
jgi:poly(3-hydroxybutyrate) depolymerase